MLCISSKLLGSHDGRHLLLLDDQTMQWVSRCPSDVYYYTGDFKSHRKCFDTLLSLSCNSIDTSPPMPYVKMMSQVTKTKSLPWQSIMPASAYSSFVKSLVTSSIDAYKQAVTQYYESTWAQGNVVLNMLQPACVDEKAYDKFVKDEIITNSALKSFEPDDKGYTKSPVYNRLGTRTGRLTHIKGPDYLTLKKSYRQLLKSRFAKGKIVYIDFSAIEVRTLFYDAGVILSDKNVDIYQQMSSDYFGNTISRDILKHAVISCIYDQKDVVLAGLMGLSLSETREFMKFINTLVQKDKLLTKLKLEYVKSQTFISNKYGRRIAITKPLDRMFINSFAQSTAVDVALIGFSAVVQEKCDDACVPIGIIHDGMLFDCDESALDRFPNTFNVDIAGFDQPFVLKSETL